MKPPFQLFSPKCQSSHMLLFSEHNSVCCGHPGTALLQLESSSRAPPFPPHTEEWIVVPFLSWCPSPTQRVIFQTTGEIWSCQQSYGHEQTRNRKLLLLHWKCLMGFFSISCSSLAKFDQIRLTNAIICGRQRGINANRHLDTSGKHFIGVHNPTEL